ncbi:MAG: hypothetical protein ACHQAX_09855, partial [Gammaproteobacteria bacterium]
HKLQIMAVCLNNANEVTSKTGEKALQMVEPIFASYFPDKETFKSALKRMFTIEGYGLVSMSYEFHKLYPYSELSHFAINLKTGCVNHISMLMPTPYEASRTINLYQRETDFEPYYIAYENDRYIAPTLAPKISNLIKSITPIAQKCLVTDELLIELEKNMPSFNAKNVIHLNRLCGAIKKLPYEKAREPLKQPEKPVTFAYTASISNKEVCDHLIEMSAEDRAVVKRLCV